MSWIKKNKGVRLKLTMQLDRDTQAMSPRNCSSRDSRRSFLSLDRWRPLLAVSLSACMLIGPSGLNLADTAFAATPVKKKTPAAKPAAAATDSQGAAATPQSLVPPPFSSTTAPVTPTTTTPESAGSGSSSGTDTTSASQSPAPSTSTTSSDATTSGDAAAAGSLTPAAETEKPKEKTTKRSSSRSRSSRSKSKSEETTAKDAGDGAAKPAEETKAADGLSTPADPTKPTDASPTAETPASTPAVKAEEEPRKKRTTSRSRRSKETESSTDTASDTKGTSDDSSKASTKGSNETTAEADEKPKTKASSKRSKGKKKGGDTTDSAEPTDTASDKKKIDVETPTAEQTPPVTPAKESEVAPPTTGSEAATDTKATEQPAATDSGTKAETGESEEVVKPRKRVTEVDPSESDEIAPAKRKRASSLTEADELMLKGKYEAAEDAYRGLIPEDQEGDAYAGLAVALAKQNWPKKVLEAEKIMKKGKEQFAENPNMIAAGAYVSYIHSKSVASPAKRDLYLEAAENLSKRAIKDSPDTVIALQTLGLVKLAQDDPEAAVPPLKKAARMAEDAYTNTLLAEAMLKVDPHDEDAKALIDEALGMDSKYHPARLQKASYLTAKGKHEEAFTELHTIPKDQRGADWQRIQGDIYKAQGDGPSALASWKEANRLDPRSPEPYKNLARHYAARGDGELAIAEYHNALEILPNDLNLRRDLAELALRQDKLEVAETEYRTILSVKESDPAALLGLSRVYFRKARKDGQYPSDWADLMNKVTQIVTEQNVAGQVIKKGVKKLTDNIQLSEAEKALSEQPPRFREARQLFSQVITTHREEPYELLTLGDQAYNDGDLKSAEEAFGYAKEINEVAPRAEQGISKIVNQRNEAKRHTELANATWKLPEIAIDHYRQALIADPQHPDAYYGLYKLYFRLKKDDKKAIDYAHTYLEASDDNDPLRKEVEDDLSRMNKRLQK